MRRLIAIVALCACYSAYLSAQQSIGTVGIADATVAGALEVSNGRAVLMGASTVTARDHTAEIALKRGGSVKVCATSGLHVTAGKGSVDAPLMLALDRGAVEIATRVTANDVVMTPDLRFTLKSTGELDLRLRVARNGDTCVENRGAAAPALNVADQFSEASYELHAGQHVLFEHGSLKEVVDHEHEPCGCPAEPVVSVADAGVSGDASTAAAPGATVSDPAKAAAEEHPFPAAVSAGLAPANSLPPQVPAGQVHAQVSTTMTYGDGGGTAVGGDPGPAAVSAKPAASAGAGKAASAATTPAPTSTTAPTSPNPETKDATAETAARAEVPPPSPASSGGNVFRSIGHFFKRLFGGR